MLLKPAAAHSPRFSGQSIPVCESQAGRRRVILNVYLDTALTGTC
jgi:hypothetical protein